MEKKKKALAYFVKLNGSWSRRFRGVLYAKHHTEWMAYKQLVLYEQQPLFLLPQITIASLHRGQECFSFMCR